MNAAERDGRICDLPIDRAYPVHTAWDLGIDENMTIWCFAPGVLHVVDYYDSSGHGSITANGWTRAVITDRIDERTPKPEDVS